MAYQQQQQQMIMMQQQMAVMQMQGGGGQRGGLQGMMFPGEWNCASREFPERLAPHSSSPLAAATPHKYPQS